MRQVPTYLIVGDGAMAHHMRAYFTGLDVAFVTWSRGTSSPEELPVFLAKASHVLLLVSDAAIEQVAAKVSQYLKPSTSTKFLIHFSGSLQTSCAFSAHPLQSFRRGFSYDLPDYQAVPWILGADAPDFSQLLPGLPNRHFRIKNTDRPYYHAMCVLASNVTALIIQQVLRRMRDRLHLPDDVMHPLLQQTYAHFQEHPEAALTGPFERGDVATLIRDRQALASDELQGIWDAVAVFYGYEEQV